MSEENATGIKRKWSQIDQVMLTRITYDETNVAWNISDYRVDHCVTATDSPIFVGGPKLNYCWKLRIDPNGDYENQNFCIVALKLLAFDGGAEASLTTTKVKVHTKVGIVDSTENLVEQRDATHSFSPGEWTLIGLFVLDDKLTRAIQPDSTFRVRCQLLVELGAQHQSIEESEVNEVNQPSYAIGDRRADVVILGAGKTFRVHRILLMEASSTFKEMLTPDPDSGMAPDTMIFPYGTEESVMMFLTYVYTRQMPTNIEVLTHARDLFNMAYRYGFPDLMTSTANSLGDSITNENAIDLYTLAHLRCPSLTLKVLQYIRTHPEVKTNEEYKLALKRYPELTQDNN